MEAQVNNGGCRIWKPVYTTPSNNNKYMTTKERFWIVFWAILCAVCLGGAWTRGFEEIVIGFLAFQLYMIWEIKLDET